MRLRLCVRNQTTMHARTYFYETPSAFSSGGSKGRSNHDGRTRSISGDRRSIIVMSSNIYICSSKCVCVCLAYVCMYFEVSAARLVLCLVSTTSTPARHTCRLRVYMYAFCLVYVCMYVCTSQCKPQGGVVSYLSTTSTPAECYFVCVMLYVMLSGCLVG